MGDKGWVLKMSATYTSYETSVALRGDAEAEGGCVLVRDAMLVDHVMYQMAEEHQTGRNGRTPFWDIVADTFCIGSTLARQVCRRYGYSPETAEKIEWEEA